MDPNKRNMTGTNPLFNSCEMRVFSVCHLKMLQSSKEKKVHLPSRRGLFFVLSSFSYKTWELSLIDQKYESQPRREKPPFKFSTDVNFAKLQFVTRTIA